MIKGEIQITVCRWLVDDLKDSWDKIVHDALLFPLSDGQDKIGWKLGSKGRFSVKSTYNALTTTEGGPAFRHIRKGKIPPKLKFFCGLLKTMVYLLKTT